MYHHILDSGRMSSSSDGAGGRNDMTEVPAMSKGDNRLKILYVLDELSKYSKEHDESSDDRFISATELIDILLSKYQLTADRKSIYSYIESLIKYGYDIEKNRKGYYLRQHYSKEEAEEQFELPELELIVDALSASRFISADKTKKIVHKLAKLSDVDGVRLHNRKLYLEKAVKSDNSSVIYSIDAIYHAINHNQKISFKYQAIVVDYNAVPSKLVATFKKNAEGEDKHYELSLFALVWKNEYYYVLCYDADSEKIKTFRVDKMKNVKALEGQPREGSKVFSKIDVNEYANTAFYMFDGKPINITLRVRKDMAGIVADRFGKNINVYHDDDENYFLCTVCVQNSHQFYSWLSGFEDHIQLTYPKDVREDYIRYLENLLSSYKKES